MEKTGGISSRSRRGSTNSYGRGKAQAPTQALAYALVSTKLRRQTRVHPQRHAWKVAPKK
jgi:hypothetical protein